MDELKVVVNITKREWEYLNKLVENGDQLGHYERLLVNGTALPKGHGRLIDADAFERRYMFDSNIEDMQDVIYALRDYKPIIKADKENKKN